MRSNAVCCPALTSCSPSHTVHTRLCPDYNLIFKLLLCRDLRQVANEQTSLSTANLLVYHMTSLWQKTRHCDVQMARIICCLSPVSEPSCASQLDSGMAGHLRTEGTRWRNAEESSLLLQEATWEHTEPQSCQRSNHQKMCVFWSSHLT